MINDTAQPPNFLSGGRVRHLDVLVRPPTHRNRLWRAWPPSGWNPPEQASGGRRCVRAVSFLGAPSLVLPPTQRERTGRGVLAA